MLHIGRHVLAHLPIAARGGTHQSALLIAQGTGQPVDLVLGSVGDRGVVGQRKETANPRLPLFELRGAESIVEAHHPRSMAHLGQR